MPVEGSLFKWHLDYLLFCHCLPAETGLAFTSLSDGLPLALTSIAVLLHLLVHARSHLEHLDHSALPLAASTCSDSLSTLTLTCLAASGALMGHLDHSAIVDLFESDLKSLFGWFHLLHLSASGASSSASPEEHVHNICII